MSIKPFSISPSPASLYITDSLRAVIHKCRYTIEDRQGLSCILGDFGLGKSTVLRFLFGDYDAKENVVAILIPTPIYPSAFAFLKAICQKFEIEAARSFQAQMKLLEDFLEAQYLEGKNIIIFIDEAQILNTAQLELIRAILNHETNEEKLVQIILGSQLELDIKLNHKRNRALDSRITTKSILKPLTVDDIEAVIDARCTLFAIENPFTRDHVEKIFEVTGGVPRSVVKLCGLVYSMKTNLESPDIPIEWISMLTSDAGLRATTL
jgi:general secretion pathway protein A